MRWTSFVPLSLALSVSMLAACGDKESEEQKDTSVTLDTYDQPVDADGDLVTEADGDCDDNNADVYPGREEECNGIDDNCNGLADEGFPDSDSDGTADCQDVEECDGYDNDGDGEIDEGFDVDGNGTADCDEVELCDGIDNDGDGDIDEGFDADGDGHLSAEECPDIGDDCDDSDAAVNPSSSESSGDLIDNDCDGLVDEGEWAEGDLIITEVMTNPDTVSDPEGEWIEVYNASERTIIMNGLIIMSSVDSDWHQVASDDVLTVEPGEYFVLGISDDFYFNGEVEVDYEYTDVTLSNEDDDLILEADGIVIDQIAWDDGATFPDTAGASMSLDPGYIGTDLNDSGDWWCAAQELWTSGSDAGSPGEDNEYCWPVASASYTSDSSLYLCDYLYLDGSGSYDPDGASITYSWELVSAPSASTLTTADINDTDDVQPSFLPDVNGTYQFSLTVFNGTEWSQPSYVSVTITDRPYNTDPVADAGSDETYENTSTCQSVSYGAYYSCDDCSEYDFELDGSSSYDPDGDWLEDPSWSITSGSSYASITDEDTWEPTVTVDGPSATYGSTSSYEVEVTIEVTDCMGASTSDTVTLTHECTGT